MHKIIYIILFFSLNIFSQNIIGKWKTVGANNKGLSIVEVYQDNNIYYGKIVEILNKKETICDYCKGQFKDKDMIGLVILKGLKKDNDTYINGEITDPEIDKTYSCTVNLENPNKLKLRGYIGFSIFGRTEHWYRVITKK